MAQIRIGITDYMKPPFEEEARAFPEAEFVFLGGTLAPDVASGLDGLLCHHMKISSREVESLRGCRIVVRYGVGYDNLDLPVLAAAGIACCNTPDYGTEEVADTAAAMILTLLRRTAEYDARARDHVGTWQENVLRPLARLRGSTLGVIGCGRIGTAVMLRLRPFGPSILGYDPYQVSGHEKAIGYERVRSLDELLSRSDVVSLHCPSTGETRGMVDRAFIARMKDGALLVNTARGSLVAGLDVLEEALRSGKLRAVAADCLPEEPPSRDHPLIAAWREHQDWIRGRLLVTPHTAYYSDQSIVEMRYKAAETLRMFLVEGRLRNSVHGSPGIG